MANLCRGLGHVARAAVVVWLIVAVGCQHDAPDGGVRGVLKRLLGDDLGRPTTQL